MSGGFSWRTPANCSAISSWRSNARRREKADRDASKSPGWKRQFAPGQDRLNQLFSLNLFRVDSNVSRLVDFGAVVGPVGAVPGCTRGSPRAPSSSGAGGEEFRKQDPKAP